MIGRRGVEKEMNHSRFISLRTLRVSHTVGLPSFFLPAHSPYAHAKSIDVDIEWPTSLIGGERPGSNEFWCQGT